MFTVHICAFYFQDLFFVLYLKDKFCGCLFCSHKFIMEQCTLDFAKKFSKQPTSRAICMCTCVYMYSSICRLNYYKSITIVEAALSNPHHMRSTVKYVCLLSICLIS